VDCSRVPDDEVSWLKTGFFNVATSFFEPCHLIIGQLDVIVCVVWALLVSYAWPQCTTILTRSSLKYSQISEKYLVDPVTTVRPPSLGPLGSRLRIPWIEASSGFKGDWSEWGHGARTSSNWSLGRGTAKFAPSVASAHLSLRTISRERCSPKLTVSFSVPQIFSKMSTTAGSVLASHMN
jgi:hypothetical protein